MFRFSGIYFKSSRVKPWRSLGIDYGSKNTALCVMEHTGFSFKILHLEMIPENLLISSFKENDCDRDFKALENYLDAIFLKYKPSVFVGELFFSRGARNQNQGLCMYMLALSASVAFKHKVKIVCVNSGAWKGKGWIQKLMPVEILYNLKVKKYMHLIDAIMLALYADKENILRIGREGLLSLIRSSSVPNKRVAKPKIKKSRKTKRVRKAAVL